MNCARTLEDVRNLLIQGKHTEALQQYIQNIKEFSDEPDMRNIGGDIFNKMGKKDEALIEYERCAQLYRDLQLYANAIAICKKMLRIDGTYEHVYAVLGDIYMEAGFVGESILNYLEYAERIRKSSGHGKLESVFRKILDSFGRNNRILKHTINGFPELKKEFDNHIDALQSIEETQERDLIELIKRDPEYRSFEKLIEMELFRSRRYTRPFSIFAIEMRFNEVRPESCSVDMEKLFGILKNNLRIIDYVFLISEGVFYGFLPETPSDGAFILSDRLVTRMKELCQHQVKISMRWATYPKDGQKLDELLDSLQKSGQVYFQ